MLRVTLTELLTPPPGTSSPHHVAPIPLSSSILGAVRYDAHDGRQRFASALDHLAELYGPLLPDGVVSATWDERSSIGLVAVGATLGPGGACWGTPVGPEGAATGAELQAVIDDPRCARDLIGTWALAGWTPSGIRLVTTADETHTLKRVEAPGATAWATRGLAAHALAGVPPALATEVVAELVLFDFVLGDRELLDATRVEEAAAVVDLTRAGWVLGTYWPLGERLAPGPPTTPESLRQIVGDVARRVDLLPGAVLGLTAGQDSALLASTIAEQGGRVDTFTMGDPSWPDVVGARAVAEALGWTHTVLGPADPATTPPPSLDAAVGWSTWTEGLEIGRDLLGPALPHLPGERTVVTGLGGETGRGVYWQGDAATSALDQLLAHRRVLPPEQHAALAGRLEAALAAVAVEGRSGLAALDVFYIDQRVRKWQNRSRPVTWMHGTLGGMLGPVVTRALIDLPEDHRRTGSGFRAAIDLGHPPLRQIVRDAIPASVTPTPWARLARRFRPPAVPTPSAEAQLIEAILAQLPDGARHAEPALGAGVLAELRRQAATRPAARRQLWTVVAIEALGLALERTAWPVPPTGPQR